jgi:steroid 5-alpha reductase family enzyme
VSCVPSPLSVLPAYIVSVTFPELLGYALAITGALYVILWIRSLIAKRMTVIDPFWGLGFPILGFSLVTLVDETNPRTWLILAMITAWSIRYACHIWFRSWGHDEASLYYPYKEQREKYGANFWWISFFTIIVPQLLGHIVIGLPVLLVLHDPGPALGWLDWLGLAVFVFGASFEAIADIQMLRFKNNPDNAGKVLDTGLWRYSRHPNYFGDAVAFWGLAIVGLSSPLGLWGLIGPGLLTVMVRGVSGVTMVETKAKIAKKPAYAEYIERTSPFVPWPPKSK